MFGQFKGKLIFFVKIILLNFILKFIVNFTFK